MGDLREEILRCRWDRRRPGGAGMSRFDILVGRIRCLIRGHYPTLESCHKPEHDYCIWCWRLMPGQARGQRVAVDPVPPEPKKPCPEGFHWIGQSLAACDQCGLPAWDHEGLADGSRDNPFSDAPFTLRPWEPGEREAIRAKWGRVAVDQEFTDAE